MRRDHGPETGLAVKVGVYFCRCGGLVSERVAADAVERGLVGGGGAAYLRHVELACGEEGQTAIAEDLARERPDRVVLAACSPRDHEETFRGVLARAGMNPFLFQMANIREQAAWVTPDPVAATQKALALCRAAIARVRLHDPLERREIEISTDVLVIGGGPAGLKAALTLAEAGRHVVLVEKGPILGGMPVRYEDVFPRLECGPCVLEPFIAGALRGPLAERIELLLLSEVVALKGSFGNFLASVRRSPRYVDAATCIGCGACIEACPASTPNPTNLGIDQRKAIDYAFFGGLPNAPYIERSACLRFRGEDCDRCRVACPVEGVVRFDEREQILEQRVGAIIVAVGGALYDARNLAGLGYGLPNVFTSLEFERLLAANGPTQGALRLSDGRTPKSVAIVHCAGSLDAAHKEYCSGTCCLNAFKFNVLIGRKVPDANVTHYARTLVAPGKEESGLLRQAMRRDKATLVSCGGRDAVRVEAAPGGRQHVRVGNRNDTHDLVVLMPPLVPSPGAAGLAQILSVGLDPHGFFEERHGRVDATRSQTRGIFIAGTCRAPLDLGRATTDGASAAGLALAALVPGRRLEIKPIHAAVDDARCSGCRTCVGVCPFKAIGFDPDRKLAVVDPALCEGCGTCVAACPSAAMQGRHFTNAQLQAEIRGVLA
jgi:heterodisulfide reductase subunit A2